MLALEGVQEEERRTPAPSGGPLERGETENAAAAAAAVAGNSAAGAETLGLPDCSHGDSCLARDEKLKILMNLRRHKAQGEEEDNIPRSFDFQSFNALALSFKWTFVLFPPNTAP